MQKGHLLRTVPILLVIILALTLVVVANSAPRGGGSYGTLVPRIGPPAASRSLLSRPVIGHEFPFPVTPMMQTQQASGPDPDYNLTPTGTVSGELQPVGSPGGTQNRIAFSSNGVDADKNGKIDGTLPVQPPPNSNLWIMRSDGTEQYQVTSLPGDEVDPAYDPGGRLLAFAARVSNTWQIFTVEVRDPSIIRQITQGPGNKRHPTWSPDSNFLGFQGDASGDYNIYKIVSTGAGSPVQLTFGSDEDTDPAWSPAGGAIAFTRDNSTRKLIYSVDELGGNLQALSNGGGDSSVSDKEPAWRFSGAELAFSSNRDAFTGDSDDDYNIWRMAAAGETNAAVPRLVSNASVTDSADETDPAYTQDMARIPLRIAYVSDRAGSQPDIWVTELRDFIPPVLRSLPSVSSRQVVPGDDVTVSVPVFDEATGVANVVASFKDPDIKQYLIRSGAWFDDQVFGDNYLERDFATVGSAILDDGDNDGVFSGDFTTLPTGRDYVIDITVTDNAGNTITYDDIYGFSTRTFAPRNQVLFVDDYCEGQLFIALLGLNNDFTASWPVESFYTFNPGFAPGTQSTIDFDSIQGGTGGGYDTWRIICRGPVPSHVYQYYLPTIEFQLDPTKIGDPLTSDQVPADRPVAVADRAVIWAAPHCGDVWIADGSIMDASTQADVALFIRRGGRMMISGENIGFALTMDGSRGNNFMATTLRSTYVQDVAFPSLSVTWFFLNRAFTTERVSFDFGLGGRPGDEVAVDPWGGGHAGDWPNWFDSDCNPTELESHRITRPNSPWFQDAAQFSYRPDVIASTNATVIYSYNEDEDHTYAAEGSTAGIRYEDTSIPNGGKLVYLAFGFEQIHRSYHPAVGPHCGNHRSHLIHNALCWERTGGFQGRVISISDGGQAINDPTPIIRAIQGNSIRYAVRCQRDGTYVMQGLPPGSYTIQAVRPGYEIDHYEAELVHGGQTPRIVDFAIKKSQPGAVSGVVTALVGGQPLANVEVSIAARPVNGVLPDPLPVLPDSVRTAADGTYTLPYIPPGEYTVTADGADILYGAKSLDVTVNAGDTTTADFQLPAADGFLAATVTDIDTTDPIENASVEARSSTGVRTRDFTDNQGQVTLTLAPGNYTVTASAPGYQTSAAQIVQISPAQTTDIAIALKREDPGTITGSVTASGSGNFLGGVRILVMFGSQVIAETTSSSAALNPGSNELYNYRVENVPTGEVTVVARRAGFTPRPDPHPPVLVRSNQTTAKVNFVMDSMRTFPRGLQLISFPADYSNVDPADLLNVPRSSFRMSAFEASRQRYRSYPDAPADRFRVGSGYWLNLSSPADLSQEGLPASDPVEIMLTPTWNLVGTPYNQRLDFFKALVRRANSLTTFTVEEATSRGILGSGLFAYVLGGYQSTGTMAPYVGYWLKANEPCFLIMSSQTGSAAAGAGEDRPGVATPKDGWLLQLRASGGGVQDTAAFLGGAPAATTGDDAGLDQGKPPVPAMGPYVYAAFADDQWSADGKAVDVRQVNTGSVWNVRVRTNLLGQRLALAWPDMSRLPQSVRPVLTDLNTGQRVYMRTASSYAFIPRTAEYRLQVTVDAARDGQLVVTPQGVSVNGAGVSVGYVVAQAATVEATVTNLAGRVVRRVTAGQLQTAGRHEIVWDGRGDNGLRAPAGRYLVTLRARTAAGQEARAVVPLSYLPR